ncbi:uncharacterized protein LOC120154994 isoform X1 [Hibiscus syriacus]|uniref:uncharacterized protein LOC120154994 isoform X1 n=1 Tax=Hibiscus syriacus TaxID=106335 RepID=UPI0019221C4F|nr:uncharacterized protein LOC120154994 isoform X1 [Hibiscus syriacus]
MVVGVLNLNIPRIPLFSPSPLRKQSRAPFVSIKASLESSNSQISTKEEENPGSASSSSLAATTFAPPPDLKAPEPKRLAVRPDKTLEIAGAALALFFRFGSGVFVSGYSASIVSENEIPPGLYCLELGGFKVKETSKIGPRPQKPIEIYEFEGYLLLNFPLFFLPSNACTNCRLPLSFNVDNLFTLYSTLRFSMFIFLCRLILVCFFFP